MKTLTIILATLTLVSCGKKSSDGGGSETVTCSSDATAMKETWRNTSNGEIYDLSACAPDTLCAVCGNYPACSSLDDFSLLYNDGYVQTQLYIQGTTKQGTWENCGDEIKISWSDGTKLTLERY